MTDIHTILLSELNRNLAGSELAKDIDDALIERIASAKRSYQAIPKSQLRFDVEEKRVQLLNEISMLQSETFFKVGHNAVLAQMIPNILIPYLIDQGAAAYEARKEQDLNVLEMNLAHFRSLLDQAVSGNAKRHNARVYGILGTIGGIGLTGCVVWYGAALGLSKNWIIPILSIPVTVVLWSMIGSLAAMLYRFNKSSDSEMLFPMRWLFTRPVTGMVMGMIVYLLMKGVLIVSGSRIPFESLGSQEVVWLVAFFAGFSDRFNDFVMNTIVGRLGGIAMEPASSRDTGARQSDFAPTHRTFQILDEMSRTRREDAYRPMTTNQAMAGPDDSFAGSEEIMPQPGHGREPEDKGAKPKNGQDA